MQLQGHLMQKLSMPAGQMPSLQCRPPRGTCLQPPQPPPQSPRQPQCSLGHGNLTRSAAPAFAETEGHSHNFTVVLATQQATARTSACIWTCWTCGAQMSLHTLVLQSESAYVCEHTHERAKLTHVPIRATHIWRTVGTSQDTSPLRRGVTREGVHVQGARTCPAAWRARSTRFAAAVSRLACAARCTTAAMSCGGRKS